MKITDIRINGIKNPIGYDFSVCRAAWVLSDETERKIEKEAIVVSETPDFSSPVFRLERERLNALGEALVFPRKPRTRYYVRVCVQTTDGVRWESLPAFFETAKMEEPWQAKWISPQPQDAFHPTFRRQFRLSDPPVSARLYISGLGLYHAELNGKSVTEECLTPGYSDYRTEIQYQTYDVTDLLQAENEFRVTLGNGWYKGKFGLKRKENLFGSRFHLIAELHIQNRDGSQTVICTDENWRYGPSQVLESGIYDGEVRCAAQTQKADSSPACKAPEGKLTQRYSIPVLEKEIMPVREVIHTPTGETVLDFGQNFAGYVVFRDVLPAGTEITLDFGEILQGGNFYRENYRKAKSQFHYIAGGTGTLVRPWFTYFGFRYCRVTGWPEDGDLSVFSARAVYSDMEQTGTLETGNSKVNRLFLNSLWGQKSNSVEFPTDCPQRDERLGWTGDAQVFAGTACYHMDAAAFYEKFARDLRTEQIKYDGILPGVIPVQGGKPIFSSVWGDIATILPTVLYEHYGDKEMLRALYPMMKAWVDKITREDQERGQRFLYDFGDQLGDWLALDGRTEQSMSGGTDPYYIGSCYYAMSVRMTAAAADALGLAEEAKAYQTLYAQIRAAILTEYFTASGRLAVDTQTGYIVALYTGIYPDRQRIIDGLRKRLYLDCWRLKGGFVGAPILCRVLAENGMENESLYFLLQEDYPGWLHCVNLGATTIWERWNSVLDDGTLSGTMMNSLNHYAYGAVVEFLYRRIAGFTPTAPGFQSISFAPLLSARLGCAKASYNSRSGCWESDWKVQPDGSVHIELTVPYGCSAELHLPDFPHSQPQTVGAGHHVFDYMPTRDYLARYSESTLFQDMAEDPEARSEIREACPILDYYLSIRDPEILRDSLSSLDGKEFMGFHAAAVKDLRDRLLRLRITQSIAHTAEA